MLKGGKVQMRVSEIVKSFEEQIAQSPKSVEGGGVRKGDTPWSPKSPKSQKEPSLGESRQPESAASAGDGNSQSSEIFSDEGQIERRATGKELAAKEQQHTVDSQEQHKQASSFDIIISHDSDLTDENGGVEMRASIKGKSIEEEREGPRSLRSQQEPSLGESHELKSTASVGIGNSRSSEISDEGQIQRRSPGKEETTEELQHPVVSRERQEAATSFEISISRDSVLTDENSGVEVQAIVKGNSTEEQQEVKRCALGKEHAAKEQHHTVERQEQQEPASSFDIVISHDSELTDEKSCVEVRALVGVNSTEEQQEPKQECHFEDQIPESTPDNDIISNHSELTDEVEIGSPAREERTPYEDQDDADATRDTFQMRQQSEPHFPGENRDIDSIHSELTDESPVLETRTHAMRIIRSPEMVQGSDIEQFCVVCQNTKDSLQQQHSEPCNHEQSFDQESNRLTSHPANDTCKMIPELSLDEKKQSNELASLSLSALHDAHAHDATLQQADLESRNPKEVARSDSNHMELKDNDRLDIHQLFQEMERSMEVRFHRLEKQCEQIPMIMEQLKRQRKKTKHIDNAEAVNQTEAHSIPRNKEVTSSPTPRTSDDTMKIATVASTETDTGIMASFPELRAYVHHLESTSTNVIADVLFEENESQNRVDTVEESPSDEAPAMSQVESETAPNSMSAEMIDSRAIEYLPSIELEALSRSTFNSDDNVQSRDDEPFGCSENIFAIELFRHDPAEALDQLVTFLAEQDNLDHACFSLICGDLRDTTNS